MGKSRGREGFTQVSDTIYIFLKITENSESGTEYRNQYTLISSYDDFRSTQGICQVNNDTLH